MKIFGKKYSFRIKNTPMTWLCVILGLLFLWAGFLRLWHLGGSSLWIDEGYSINAAQAVQKTGLPILESKRPYPLHTGNTYLTAVSLSIGHFDPLNPWQARLPAAIFGILSILAVYFFSYTQYKKKSVALLSALLMAFSFWEIAWSRQARGYIMMQFFALLSFGFFTLWLEDKKISKLFVSILCFAGAFLGQSLAVILLPVYLVIGGLHMFKQENISKKTLSFLCLGTLIGIGAIIFFVQLTSHHLTMYIQPDYPLYLLKNYGWLVILGFVPIIGGFFKEDLRVPSLVGIFLIYIPLGILTFWSSALQFRYILVLFPFLLAQAASGTGIVTEWALQKKFFRAGAKTIITTLVVGGLIFATYLNLKPFTNYLLEPGSPQPSFEYGYKFIMKNKEPSSLVISPYAHMTKIYLGTPGLLLPISLTGHSNEIAASTRGGIDFYTGAPALLDLEQFREILQTREGYILLDRMAESRIRKTYLPIITGTPGVKEVYKKLSGTDRIKVFHFQPIASSTENQ